MPDFKSSIPLRGTQLPNCSFPTSLRNCRAQNPRYLKPQEKTSKTANSKPNFSEEDTGNRNRELCSREETEGFSEPETGNQNSKMGPRG
ncbi:MAG: hypothetical protein ACLFUZ_03275, partial [Candidatus Micrarchaeia archaeon]